MMPLREYVLLVMDKIDAAMEAGNRAEVARLLRLLSEVAGEQARELEP
jgi:hypothetical protein